MADKSRQENVLRLLQGLRGIEPLKELVWRELGYTRKMEGLSRRELSESARAALADDPVLFATAGAEDKFQVIYSKLSSDQLRLGDERPVVSSLLKNHPYSLFVFSNKGQDRWHFLNVKYDDSADRRRLFRRISVGPAEQLRTASERISMLAPETISPDLFGLSPLAVQNRHDEAFDVEKVTDEFFSEYKRVFEYVEGEVKGIKGSDRQRLFTQKLFNRLMFVVFVQKKGWLRFNKSEDYLSALWRDYAAHRGPTGSFYGSRLRLLFFQALNDPRELNVGGANRDRADGSLLQMLIGDVPYLNGGLFEEDDDDRDERITVPDDCFPPILKDLFGSFNFTVTESTPLDIEVAVDPEMLGRVFEELVTGRHETGSYYTPRPVVAFMCREALKGYLGSALPLERGEAVARFVEGHDPAGLHDSEAVLGALRRMTAVDPACGSGAYLLGMLHELFALRQCLFQAKNLDPKTAYDRKLEIIQHNLYGVDLDPFAVNIARLRLWLSLAVDHEGVKPEPLPNLDFKIEQGDSLGAKNPEIVGQMVVQDKLVTDYLKAKEDFLMAHGQQKLTLRQEVLALKEQVALWTRSKRTPRGFDWPVEFAEVFREKGFDVVLANPPYVNMVQMEDVSEAYRSALRGMYDSASGGFDLFVPFMERGVQLLRPGGQFAYITPNKYLSAEYAEALRKFLGRSFRLSGLCDLTNVPVFTASVYPYITLGSKNAPSVAAEDVAIYRARVDGTSIISMEMAYTAPLSLTKVTDSELWAPLVHPAVGRLLPALRSRRHLEDEAVITGAATVDEAYKWESALHDQAEGLLARSPTRYAKFVVSGNIRRYHHTWGLDGVRYLKHTYSEPVLDLRHKAITEKRRLQIRASKVIVSGMAKRPIAVFDDVGIAAGKSTVILVPKQELGGEYLTALLNSGTMKEIYEVMFGALSLAGGYMRFGPPQIKALPCPDACRRDRERIASIVHRISSIRSRRAGLREESTSGELERLEREVDERVKALFGLG